jgi:putative ABC transport system ATP-binding protein
MIELVDIRKVYNAGKPNEFIAVRGVNLSIAPNKATVLKGPSGSGKTTLLSIIGCMTRPTSGRVRLLNLPVKGPAEDSWSSEVEVTGLPERFLTETRRKTFGFIFQQFNLIKGITAIENVMLPAYPCGERHGLLRKRASELLALFNLSGKATSKIEWLSGGEAQRVAIARALINNPSVIIADEPTAHLDTKLSEEFMGIMKGLKDEGRTVLMASHDPLVYASDAVDRVIEMRDGEIIGSSVAP